ncbi:MAG: ribosome small subunit-dependent GTPase A [Candidatus Hydrogenedentota bacterium]
MAKNSKRKKKNRVRQRDWTTDADNTFSHDLKKHRRTDTTLSGSQSEADLPTDFEANGLVISHSKKWVFVQRDGAEDVETCQIHERLGDRKSTIAAAGDRVFVEDGDEGPLVTGVAARRSKLSRLAIEHSHVNEQVFAANIDFLVIVVSAAKPAIKQGLIDRYLISAEVGNVESILCVNKMDLVDAEPDVIQFYRDIDIPIVLTSCEDNTGVDELRNLLKGKWSVFAGHSGVGKSTILNLLSPELDIATREVSRHNEKGKHTTSLSRLYRLEDDIHIVDTPGIRQLGLWNVSAEEVSFYFPEIAYLGESCKFRDCTHTHEPGCDVQAALEEGRLNAARFESYVRIREDLEQNADTGSGGRNR